MYTLEQTNGMDRLAYACLPGERLARWQSEGRGISVDHAMAPREALALAMSDWTVSKRALYSERAAPDENGKRAIRLPEHVALVRDSDETVLGVASPGYTPAQNVATLETFIGTSALVVAAAGIEGGRVYAQCALEPYVVHAPGGEDRVRTWLTFLLGHDGATAARIGRSSVRAVCENTMTASTEGLTSHRHTKGIGARLRGQAELFADATRAAAREAEMFDKLARAPMSETAVRDMLAKVFPGDTSRVSRRRDEALALFAGAGDGASLAGKTAWGAYNAVTQSLRGRGDGGVDAASAVDAWLWNDLADTAANARGTALQLLAVVAA